MSSPGQSASLPEAPSATPPCHCPQRSGEEALDDWLEKQGAGWWLKKEEIQGAGRIQGKLAVRRQEKVQLGSRTRTVSGKIG